MNNDKLKKILICIIGVLILIVLIILLLSSCNKEYKITFDTDGGTSITSLSVDKDDLVTKPTNPTKDGYKFVGWYLNGKEFNFDTPITDDIVLVAKWEKIESEEKVQIDLDQDKLSVVAGESVKINATLTGDEQPLIYESSNESIATVDASGNVKGIKAGKVIITIKTKDGNIKAECEVTILDSKDDEVNVTGVSITGSSEVTVGSTIKLKAVIKPDDATNKKVTWKSSNTKIATVDKNGNVKGIKAGTVKITVTTDDGKKTATKEIEVKAKVTVKPVEPDDTPTTPQNVDVTKVTISGPQSVNVKGKINLSVTITPNNATNKTVTWQSSDNSKATVSQSGVVTGVSEGTVTITAKSANGIEGTYTVTVKSVYTITFTKQSMEGVGGSIQYSVALTKDGSSETFKAYTYAGSVKKSPYIDAGEINKEIKSVEVTLSDGRKVTANCIYKD